MERDQVFLNSLLTDSTERAWIKSSRLIGNIFILILSLHNITTQSDHTTFYNLIFCLDLSLYQSPRSSTLLSVSKCLYLYILTNPVAIYDNNMRK